MEIVLLQHYSTAHKTPKLSKGRASKRALEYLPNYTCHIYVPTLDCLFAGKQNGEVVKWKTAKKEGRHTLEIPIGTHGGPVTCILHHPAFDKFVITGGSDSYIKIWDMWGNGIDGNKCIQSIPAHNATVTSLAAHCDVLLSCSCDKTMKVWKADTGRSSLKYPWFVIRQLFVFDYWTTCIWSFPNKIAEDTMGEIYVGDSGGGLTMLRSVAAHQLDSEKVLVDELELVRPHIRGFRSLGITCILPVPTLNVILTCCYDDAVRLSDISTIETLVNLPNKDNPGQRYVSMVWSAAQEELVLADADGYLMVWNSRADKFVAFTKACHKVSHITTAEMQGRHVIIASTSEAVKIFTVKRSLPYKRHLGHTQRVLDIFIYTNPETDKDPLGEDRCLVSASVDNTICYWSLLQGLQCTKTMTERYSEISAFLFVPESRIAVTGHENGSLKIWNINTDKTWRFAGHGNTISAMVYVVHRHNTLGVLEENQHVVTVSYDGCLAVWEVSVNTLMQPKLEGKINVSRDELLCVVHDKLKHTYITAGNAGEISTWNLRDVHKPQKLMTMTASPEYEYAVTTLALDGNYLFSGSEDETIRMWDTHTGELLRSFRETGEVNALCVIPATGNILSATRSGGVKMWSQLKGSVIASFESPVMEELRCLAYCKATEEVFVGTEEGGILRITLTVHTPDPYEIVDDTAAQSPVSSHTLPTIPEEGIPDESSNPLS